MRIPARARARAVWEAADARPGPGYQTIAGELCPSCAAPARARWRLGEEQQACWLDLARAVAILDAAEPPDKVVVALGARLRPQPGGSERRRAGHGASSPAGGRSPKAVSARVAVPRQRLP